MGTRFAQEKCYDETGIREMLRAQKEDQEDVAQMRKICGSQAACGGGGWTPRATERAGRRLYSAACAGSTSSSIAFAGAGSRTGGVAA